MLRRTTWGVSVCALLFSVSADGWVRYQKHDALHRRQRNAEHRTFTSVLGLTTRASVESQLVTWRKKVLHSDTSGTVIRYYAPRPKCRKYLTCSMSYPQYIIADYDKQSNMVFMRIDD